MEAKEALVKRAVEAAAAELFKRAMEAVEAMESKLKGVVGQHAAEAAFKRAVEAAEALLNRQQQHCSRGQWKPQKNCS